MSKTSFSSPNIVQVRAKFCRNWQGSEIVLACCRRSRTGEEFCSRGQPICIKRLLAVLTEGSRSFTTIVQNEHFESRERGFRTERSRPWHCRPLSRSQAGRPSVPLVLTLFSRFSNNYTFSLGFALGLYSCRTKRKYIPRKAAKKVQHEQYSPYQIVCPTLRSGRSPLGPFPSALTVLPSVSQRVKDPIRL